jgi:hypothetical protein
MNIIKNYRSFFQTFPQLSSKATWTVENAVLAVWLFAVVASTLTHELWRDETREYLMAVEIDSFSEYFRFAKYDGHPLLWRTILMGLHWLIPHPVILQMASLVIGFFAVYLFVKHSPFPLLIKVLFIFGVIPFSTNAVDARDYGISMLLFFALAVFSTKVERHPIVIGVLLFLESNTNQYGMYMSGLFLAGWILDSGLHVLKERRHITAAIIALAGIALSMYSTRIDAESVFTPVEYLSRIDFGKAFLNAFPHPGEYIYYILNIPLLYRDIFIIGLIVGLFVIRPYFGLMLYITMVVFNFVAIAFIHPQTRHQGVLFGFIMTLYWITLHGIQTKERPGLFRHAKGIYSFVLFAFLLPFMVHQIQINNFIVHEEARVEKSSAMALGKYLNTNVQLAKAIIIGSPEYMLEPIAYYSKNKIFLVQENCFRDFVKFSREYQKTESLIELLKAAENLYTTYSRPVIIVLGYFDIKEKRSFPTIYRGNFNTSDIEEFKEKTIKIAEFNHSLGDENYQVFLYAPKDNLIRYHKKYMELR